MHHHLTTIMHHHNAHKHIAYAVLPVGLDYIPILGTASKYALRTLFSFLWSSENVTSMTLLDDVKRKTGGVHAPDIPHHLKYISIDYSL